MKGKIIAATLFGSLIFASLYANLIPGGDFEMKLLMGIIIFLIGEIAVFASRVIDKLDKLGIK